MLQVDKQHTTLLTFAMSSNCQSPAPILARYDIFDIDSDQARCPVVQEHPYEQLLSAKNITKGERERLSPQKLPRNKINLRSHLGFSINAKLEAAPLALLRLEMRENGRNLDHCLFMGAIFQARQPALVFRLIHDGKLEVELPHFIAMQIRNTALCISFFVVAQQNSGGVNLTQLLGTEAI